jgi:hypothetical protein
MAGKGKRKKAKKLEREQREQRELFQDLHANRRRREKLKARVEDERKALSGLLVAGAAAGVAVGDLAREAGISRTQAQRLLSLAAASREVADQSSEPEGAAAAAGAVDGGAPG